MKILVIQLARLGDIYMTWPALRALRRLHPQAEIHFLTRPRFEGAVEGLTEIDRHLTMSTSNILEPMLQAHADMTKSAQRMDQFVGGLKKEKYDWVINFTFSPFSSYLTHALTDLKTRVSGYTRHADGFLNLPDEVSAYFYAQVGVEKWNRVHLTDLFASMVGVDFVESDWAAPQIESQKSELPDNYVVLHIGASEHHKSLPEDKWVRMLTYFIERKPQMPVVLIGADSERHIAEAIREKINSKQIVDLVGHTQIADLFPIIQNAVMLVGCDSAPIHIASLTDTATLNISLGNVNFWETGPKATHGFIYRAENTETLVAQRVAEVLALLLEGNVAPELIGRGPGLTSYQKTETPAERFRWDVVQALYLSKDFPMADDIRFYEAILKLEDINGFIIEQLSLPKGSQPQLVDILNRAEEIIQSISQLVPEVSPIVSWYQAEKTRIPPGAREDVLSSTLNIHRALDRVLQVYIPQDETRREGVVDGKI